MSKNCFLFWYVVNLKINIYMQRCLIHCRLWRYWCLCEIIEILYNAHFVNDIWNPQELCCCCVIPNFSISFILKRWSCIILSTTFQRVFISLYCSYWTIMFGPCMGQNYTLVSLHNVYACGLKSTNPFEFKLNWSISCCIILLIINVPWACKNHCVTLMSNCALKTGLFQHTCKNSTEFIRSNETLLCIQLIEVQT